MAISSSATGLRPGVVTSTTRPTNPYTGQIIYETDTGYLRVWDGSAWDYLSKKQDDTVGLGPVGGLVLVKSQTIGIGVATVVVPDAFSSAYDNYRIVVSGGTVSSPDYLYVQLSSITGNVYATNTGHMYPWYPFISPSGNSSYGFSNNGGNTNGTMNRLTTAIIEETYSFEMEIQSPNLAKVKTVTNFSGACRTGLSMGRGFVNSTTQSTGFTISTDGSTFTGGTIRVYGYRNV